jgi:hypothetical protein
MEGTQPAKKLEPLDVRGPHVQGRTETGPQHRGAGTSTTDTPTVVDSQPTSGYGREQKNTPSNGEEESAGEKLENRKGGRSGDEKGGRTDKNKNDFTKRLARKLGIDMEIGIESWGRATEQTTSTNRLGERELEESDEQSTHSGPATRRRARKGFGQRRGRTATIRDAERCGRAEEDTPQGTTALKTRVRNRANVGIRGAAKGPGEHQEGQDALSEGITAKASGEPREKSVQESPKGRGGGPKLQECPQNRPQKLLRGSTQIWDLAQGRR